MDKIEQLDPRGYPEISHKQKILDMYYKMNSAMEIYINMRSDMKNIKPQYSGDPRRIEKIRMFEVFKNLVHAMYFALRIYKLKETEKELFVELDEMTYKNTTPGFDYLYKCVIAFGEIINRIGLTDFPIEQIPKTKAYLEGL